LSFYDLKINEIKLEIVYPIKEPETIIKGDMCLRNLGITSIKGGQGNISDTGFHCLSDIASTLKTKKYFSFRITISGYHNGKKKFEIIDDDYEGELGEEIPAT